MNKSTVAFLISFAIIAAIGTIVFAAISAGVLGWLIIGVMVLGLFALGVSHIGVGLADRFIDALNKRYDARNEYHLACLKLGYQPIGATYALLPAPQMDYEPDIPVSIVGVSPQELIEYRTDAENLVALSKKLIMDGIIKDKAQIAPFNKARKVDYFRDVQVWINAVRYLMANNMAEERKEKNKHIGTFCVAGTVDQLYQRFKN